MGNDTSSNMESHPLIGSGAAAGHDPVHKDSLVTEGSQETHLFSEEPSVTALRNRAAAHVDVLCMACTSATCDFKPTKLKRRALGEHDILIDMKYCGVCHSDLHRAADHNAAAGATLWPCVPGHELAGLCAEVGSGVTKFRVGDQVGVGCMVDSCQECDQCSAGEEQKCSKLVGTYNGTDKGSGRAESFPKGSHTLGGYTDKMVVDENFGILIPAGYPLECAGPVMCAGITMYEPLKKHGVQPGSHVGIVGLGGLGQMGIKLGAALGCTVTVISRSDSKRDYALNKCGADHFIVSSESSQMASAAGQIDLILNTIPSYHDYCQYNSLLSSKPGAKQVLLGLHKGIGAAMVVDKVLCGKSKVGMSAIGGIKNTQEVVDLCAKNDIKPDIKVVPVTELNHVYTLLDSGNKDNLRYVLDLEGTLTQDAHDEWPTDIQPPTLSPVEGSITLCGVLCECLWLLCCCKAC